MGLLRPSLFAQVFDDAILDGGEVASEPHLVRFVERLRVRLRRLLRFRDDFIFEQLLRADRAPQRQSPGRPSGVG